MLVGGVAVPVVKQTSFWGEKCKAVLAASETPSHARSSIRKVLAYKKVLIGRNRAKAMPCKEDRRATYMVLGQNAYRMYYGLN